MDGPILLEFSTELVVDYPAKSFMQMPILVRIVHAKLNGQVIVNYSKDCLAVSLSEK